MDIDVSNENRNSRHQHEDVEEHFVASEEPEIEMFEETNKNYASDDGDDTSDNEEESMEDENLACEIDNTFSQPNDSSNQANRTERGKKRRKPANRRKNIRKVLKIHQLDPKTLEAQKEEQERLHRLELQRGYSTPIATTSVAPKNDIAPPKNDIVPPNNDIVPHKNDIVPAENEIVDDNSVDSTHPILILDDGENDEYDDVEDDDSQSGSEEIDIHSPDIILISSSDSEDEAESRDNDRAESDSSEDYTSTVNVNSDDAGVLVNIGHLPDDPDIFLPPQIAKVIKSHQIVGVRFLYENLIESVKNYSSNHGLGCILAHAMGLGKTIQTISLIHIFLRFTQSKNVLVLVPINTLQNWLSEFDMWVPGQLKDGSKSNESKCENVLEDRSEEEEIKRNIVNDKEHDLSDKSDKDIGIQSSSSEPSLNETKHDKQMVSEDIPEGSSISQNCNDQKIAIEYRDYEVLIINDSQKSTASRAKIVDQWHTNGGVLIMGYEMFRIISLYKASLCNSVTNAKGKKKKKAKASATVIDIEEEEKEMELMLDMQKALCDPGPDLVVCDEGHRIKNPQSNIHHALHRIRTRKRLVLTGYPLQNNLTEYWCMVDFVRPNYLGSRQEFQNMFERPIINGQCIDSTAEDKKLMKYRAHVLSSLLRGFVQRRDYTALKVALPPKEEHIIMVRMSKIQEAIYRRFLLLMQEGYGEQLNPIKIFAVCSKIWNHPDMLYKAMIADQSKNSVLFDSDVDMLMDDAIRFKNSSKQTQSDTGFNPFANDAKTLLLKITNWAKEVFDSHDYVEGIIENGGKLVILMELINESLAQGDKMLIFSQSLLTLDLIEEVLSRTPVFHENTETTDDRQMWRKNIDYFRIDGSTSSSERERLIEMFNRKENLTTKVFLLSTRAGCLGINLVGANRVVVFDVSWNPCHDAQAVCRVYRYGQQKPCYIYRLIASNTMEKRMYYRQISKQGVSDRVVDEMNPVENFSKDELTKLLSVSWENEPPSDFMYSIKLITDPVLKQLCLRCTAWIVTLPFQHESLLSDQTSSKLSNREKREAKKDYEDEKRKAVFGMNGPLPSRASPYSQRQNIPILDIPQSMNHASSSIQDQLLQNRMLSGQHTISPRAATTAAFANILRHVQQLRTEDSSAAHFRLLNSLNNDASMQNVLHHLNLLHSANLGHVNNSTATITSRTTNQQTPNNSRVPGSVSSMQQPFVPTTVTQHCGNRASYLPVNEDSCSNTGDSTDILLTCDNDQGTTNSLHSEPRMTSGIRNQVNEQSKSINSKEVICIDSDGENE